MNTSADGARASASSPSRRARAADARAQDGEPFSSTTATVHVAAAHRDVGSRSSNQNGIGEASDNRTTLMIRNLPPDFTRQMLEELLDEEGFAACYDFIYLPADILSGTCFCYAFINFTMPEDAQRFKRHFTGFTRWPVRSPKEGAVDWTEALEGLPRLIERYRNSPLMHASVPEHFRPAIYQRGINVPFPEPSVRIRAPRVRRSLPSRVRAKSSAPGSFASA